MSRPKQNPDEGGADLAKAVPVRRTPVQGRSSETVQHIFQAASVLLGTVPLDEITTSRIAQEAGISIGALYRFFPDKQSIIDAIAVKHMEDFGAALERRFLEAPPANGPAFLVLMIDAYLAFLDAHPDFRTLALGRHISALTRQQQADPDAGPAALVKMFMTGYLGVPDSEDLDLKLRVATEAGECLITYAYAQKSPEERGQVIAQMKSLLAQYLFGAR